MASDCELWPRVDEESRANPLSPSDSGRSLDHFTARRAAVTLNQLSFLAAVARRGNLTKASADLRVSQPSVSQQLKQLEQRYGAKIYRRVSKGVEITEAGQVLLRMITPILEQVARLEAGFKSVSEESEPEVLTVGGTFSASAVLLPRLLACLRKQHPRAEMELQTNSSDNLERLVLNSALDMAVIDRKGTKDLKCEPLRREGVVAFVPAKHRLASRVKVELADLLAEPLIVRGGKGIAGTTEKMFRRFRDQGLPVNIALRCEGPAAVKAAVRQEMGVGVAFEDVIQDEIESGEFKPIKVRGLPLGARSFIIYSKHRALSPIASDFLRLLREVRAESQRCDGNSPRAVEGKVNGEAFVRRNLEGDVPNTPPTLAPMGEMSANQGVSAALFFGLVSQPILWTIQTMSVL